MSGGSEIQNGKPHNCEFTLVNSEQHELMIYPALIHGLY